MSKRLNFTADAVTGWKEDQLRESIVPPETIKGSGMESSMISKANSTSVNSAVNFMKSLDRLQEQQLLYTRKLEKEKKRKEQLDHNLESARAVLRDLQEKTRNGLIVNDNHKVHRKVITRLETQLQKSKVKLSVAKRDNVAMKKKIDNLRRDKILLLQICRDLDEEQKLCKKKTKHAEKEMASLNAKKHTVEVAIVNTKHKMLRDMEEFSRELATTKQNISSTQESILGSIRERLQATFELSQIKTPRHLRDKDDSPKADKPNQFQNELAFMKEIGVTTVDELVALVERSDEQVFALYHEVQSKSEELEQVELENRHLEAKLAEQELQLEQLEKQNNEVRQELEQHISLIQKSIAKFDMEYAQNMDVLTSIAESMLNLLKNLAVEGEALDQQLLSTGVTDRNVQDFLGLVEQRIDELIQMSNAAMHMPIRKEDFLQLGSDLRKGALRIPTLPSLTDGAEEEDVGDMENGKVQPINIGMLKDYMQKKMSHRLGKKAGSQHNSAPTTAAVSAGDREKVAGTVTNQRPFQDPPTPTIASQTQAISTKQPAAKVNLSATA